MSDHSCIGKIAYNKKTFESERALDCLTRLAREFNPILKKRGWSVDRLSELCCCFGGKLGKKEGGGLLGYCMPYGDGLRSRGIYIRLRSPDTSSPTEKTKFDVGHAIGNYDSMAAVMAHEIAHIVHGKHSVEFYKLTDELYEEWVASSGGGGGKGYTVFGKNGSKVGEENNNTPDGNFKGGQGAALGGGIMGGVRSKEGDRNAAAEAAARRAKTTTLMQGSGKKLGGGRVWVGSGGVTIDPKEAAKRAAIRREEDLWCQECQDLTISDDSSSSDDDVVLIDMEAEREFKKLKREKAEDVIDLCNSQDDSNDITNFPLKKPENKNNGPTITCKVCTLQNDIGSTECLACGAELSVSLPTGTWRCSFCTAINSDNLSSVRCGSCGQLRPEEVKRREKASENAIAKIQRKELSEAVAVVVKEDEVKRAEGEFGFNIYGTVGIRNSSDENKM